MVQLLYEYSKKISSGFDLILICGSCYLAGEFLALKGETLNIPKKENNIGSQNRFVDNHLWKSANERITAGD